MWVTKLLISPVKIRIFCPKKSKFGPKMAFLFILGQALPAHLVGGCGTRAVSRKTPIYFIFTFCCAGYGRVAGLHVMSVLYRAPFASNVTHIFAIYYGGWRGGGKN